MPAADSPEILIANYLKSHGYTTTLAAFLAETNLTEEQIDKAAAITIESLLQEKKVYDVSVNLSRTQIAEPAAAETWREPSPSIPTELHLPPAAVSNILSVRIITLPTLGRTIITTTASRHLLLHSAHPPYPLLESHGPFSSPLLATAEIAGRILTSSMTGSLMLLTPAGETVHTFKPHSKYCTNIASHGTFLATSSYDNSIVLHRILPEEPYFEELARTEVATPPEGLAFAPLPGSDEYGLVYTRRDDPAVRWLALPALQEVHCVRLAEEGSALVFHGAHVAVGPQDARVLAVAGSNIPGMKVYYVKDGVLQGEYWTGAEQGVYSLAVCAWRGDGGGVWVNADDGRVRGVDLGGRRKEVREVAAGGVKVRSLWSGDVDGSEVLVTGDYAKSVKVWRTGAPASG